MKKNFNLPNNRTLVIEQDDTGSADPRGWDNLGTMVCFHRNYSLGDKHSYKQADYSSWEEMKQAIIRKEDVAVILPLYLYDHSGITMKTTPFNCRWDSGQVGWIFVSKKKVRDNFGVKKLNAELIKKATDILVGEVATYDQFITGDVYRFEIIQNSTCDHGHNHTEHEDSCGGFFGSDVKENGILDHISEEDKVAVLEQV